MRMYIYYCKYIQNAYQNPITGVMVFFLLLLMNSFASDSTTSEHLWHVHVWDLLTRVLCRNAKWKTVTSYAFSQTVGIRIAIGIFLWLYSGNFLTVFYWIRIYFTAFTGCNDHQVINKNLITCYLFFYFILKNLLWTVYFA